MGMGSHACKQLAADCWPLTGIVAMLTFPKLHLATSCVLCILMPLLPIISVLGRTFNTSWPGSGVSRIPWKVRLHFVRSQKQHVREVSRTTFIKIFRSKPANDFSELSACKKMSMIYLELQINNHELKWKVLSPTYSTDHSQIFTNHIPTTFFYHIPTTY